jgi:succinyl-diaminopimelate desuccinylase
VIDPVELTQKLTRLDTRNPPGNETACAELLAALLGAEGFAVEVHSFGENRVNLIATLGQAEAGIAFTGHLDVVPLGTTEWSVDPFGGDIVDGRIYGRGTTDMKGGVAAMIAACCAERETIGRGRAVSLILSGGEETGSDGARALADAGLLPSARLLVVGEPTGNRFLAGHRGALWLRACTHGTTAHGSTPHLGENAIYKAARAAVALHSFEFNVAAHPVMGRPTLNLGTISGGQNINSVPDRAEFTLDIRTVPGQRHERVADEIGFAAGEDVEFTTLLDLPPVWSDPGGPVLHRAGVLYEQATGRAPEAESATYFTDAGVLTPAMRDVATIICGPGDPELAHTTDESCSIDRIREAQRVYQVLVAEFA